MKFQQLSVFLENRSGRMAKILTAIGDAGINLRAMSLADTSDFGILRLIVDDLEKARDILKENGFTVRISEVVAVEIPDTPGALAGILKEMEQAELNVEYMYSFLQKTMDSAVIIFRFEDLDQAIETLERKQIRIFNPGEIW